MTSHNKGWLIFVGSLGMMATLLSGDIKQLGGWQDIFMPSFVGTVAAHFGTVVAAFIGGRIIPTEKDE